MTNLIVETSKYLMLFLFACYTYECFAAFRGSLTEEKKNRIFSRQIVLMYLIHLDGYLAVYAVTDDVMQILFYALQVLFAGVTLLCCRLLYPRSSRLLANNMCMLLLIGFLILTRLSEQLAFRQFVIAGIAMAATLILPYIVRKAHFLRKLTWVFAAVGIMGLGLVALLGRTDYGAKLAVEVLGVTIQPSEFIKVIFVFFVAGLFSEGNDFGRVCLGSAVAAVHVLILVASRDLGGALFFFVTYLVMLCVATGKLFYLAGGMLAGSIAAVAAYHLFSHVQVRVIAWQDPLSVIDNEGYQICQSLFAIGTGGWFGMGLYQGMPERIPVVEQDFIYSAIAEELGGIFALCLLMVCVSCLLMIFYMAMQVRENFYRLIALGLGTVYGFQVFLTIGGVTKFIPSTGVTLPFVSYGGSSLLSTMALFAIVQGICILRQDKEGAHGKKAAAKSRERKTDR